MRSASRHAPMLLCLFLALGLAMPDVSQAADAFTITAPLAGRAITSCTDLTMSGGTIDSTGVSSPSPANKGNVATNGNITLSGSSTIQGDASVGPGKKVTTSGTAHISGASSVATSAFDCKPIDLVALKTTLQSSNDNARIPQTGQHKNPLTGTNHTDFVMSGSDTLTLSAGTYYFTSFVVSGSSVITVTGPVHILCSGSVSMSGSSAITGTNSFNVRFWVSGASVALSGATMKGFLYAPSASVSLSNGTVVGGIFANSVTLSGSSHVTRTIDDVIPHVAITSPADNSGTSDRVHVVVKGTVADGETDVAVKVNGQPAAIAADGTWQITLDLSGSASPVTVSAVATDIAGNTAAASIHIITAPPAISLTSPLPAASVATRIVSLAGAAGTATALTVNGTPAAIAGGVWSLGSFDLGPDGAHTLSITGTNPAGATTIAPIITNDTTPPVVTTLVAPTPNAAGWNKSSATVTFTCSDATSGVATCPAPVTVTVETASQTVSGTATDKVGNQKSALVTVKLDKTAPVVAIQTPTSGSTLSSTQATITGTATDSLSGLAGVTCGSQAATVVNSTFTCSVTLVTGANDVAVTATDVAGNPATTTAHYTVNTDQQAPVVTITSPAGGSFTKVPAVTVTGTATDDVAVASVTVNGQAATLTGSNWTVSIVLPAGDGSKSIAAVATDTSNKSSTASISIVLDTTTPAITAALAPASNAAGWNRTDATVSFTCSDATSGIATCTAATTLTAETASQSVAGTAVDKAGNQSSSSITVKLDETPPVVAVQSPSSGSTLSSTQTTIRGTVADALSGVVGVTCGSQAATVANGTFACSMTLVAGANDVAVVATDVAGNSATTTIHYTVIIDQQAPVVTITAPAAGFVTNLAAQTVTGTATDDVAVASVTVNGQPATLTGSNWTASITFSGDGAKPIAATATDTSNKSTTATVNGMFDATPPVVVVQSPASGSTLTTPQVTITGTVTDALSGVATVTCGSQQATLAVGTFTCQVALTEGANDVAITARDVATNSTTTTVHYTVTQLVPTIISVTPLRGLTAGGEVVTIVGTNFTADTRVTIGGIAATIVSRSASQLAITTPPSTTEGPLPLVVSNAAGAATAQFEYFSVVSLTIDRPMLHVPLAGTGTLQASARLSDGLDYDVTSSVTWTSSNTAITSVNGGTLQGIAIGSATIHATMGTFSAACTVTVVPSVTSFAISPATRLVHSGYFAAFVATATYVDGSSAEVTDVAVWTAPGALAVQPGGVALTSGTVLVTAAYCGRTATATVTVDDNPPALTVDQPLSIQTRSTAVTISGSITDEDPVSIVYVGAESVPVVGGRFQTTVQVPEGKSQIFIYAVDQGENQSRVTINVVADASPPELAQITPDNNAVFFHPSATISGFVYDNVGVQSVTINGANLTIGPDASFSRTVTLQAGANAFVVTAIDGAGNVNTTSLTLWHHPVPVVRILEPRDLAILPATTTRVRGTTNAESVTVNGVPATVGNGEFLADVVPLAQGRTVITALATEGGYIAAATLNVYRDSIPPRITVESPVEGSFVDSGLIPVAGSVEDIVVGTINSEQMRVTVNGHDATVANRAFLLPDLALTDGANAIVVTATDQGGNTASVTRQIVYRPVAAGQAKLILVAGDAQTAPIGQFLPEPVSVKLTNVDGSPAAGRKVNFRVLENNGSLTAGSPEARLLTVTTDTQGSAVVRWRLGTRSGAGNQRAEVWADGFIGRPQFIASGTPGPPVRIVVDSGNEQFGLVAQVLPRPLIAIVVDSGSNRLQGIPVTFTMTAGGGSFDGQTTVTVATDADGRAVVTPTLGEVDGVDNNVFTARIAGAPPAVFMATARMGGPPSATSIAGVILDNTDRPVAGASILVEGTPLTAHSDSAGQFTITGAPVGYVKLFVDGSTVQAGGTWPTLEYAMYTLPGIRNTIGMPIYLLPIDIGRSIQVDEVTGGTLSFPEMPGFALTIQPGAATFPGGSRTGRVSVTLVHADKLPMPPGFGQQPRFLVTIQPPGVHFDPPASISFPNVDGFGPGKITEFYSFDHDLGQFVSIGTGSVTEDGLVVRSNPGVGIIKGGWHCGGDPAPDGTTAHCPECQECLDHQCRPNPVTVDMSCPFDPTALSTPRRVVALSDTGSVTLCSAAGSCAPVTVTLAGLDVSSSAGGGNGVDAFGGAAFLAQREFSDAPDGNVLSFTANVTPPAARPLVRWTVSASIGNVRLETPPTRQGPTFSFVPNPGDHPDYVHGTGCGDPGNGTCALNPPLAYNLQVRVGTAVFYKTVNQDEKDMIRQEYANHGLTIFNRDQFHPRQRATHYPDPMVFSSAPYTLLVGEPWTLADAVWVKFNEIVDDDKQEQPVGTTGLDPDDVVVSPGADVDELDRPVLTTWPCYPRPQGSLPCDDKIDADHNIVAGANGIADTMAKPHTTDYTPQIDSGWRNPHRNEAFSKARFSNHQAGEALDLAVPAIPFTSAKEAWCILNTAASQVATRSWCENTTGVEGDCTVTPVLHIHTDMGGSVEP